MPSTKEDLKRYAKNAKKREMAKKERKANFKPEKENPHSAAMTFKRQLKEDIPRDSINKKRFIARYVKIINEKIAAYEKDKGNDKRWTPSIPVYSRSEKDEYNDSNFVYDVQTSLVQFSWKELDRLIAGGLGKKLKTQTYTKAFHTAEYMMHRVLGVVSDDTDVRFKLKDRDVTLKLWPVAPKDGSKKMSKSDKSEKKSKSTEEVVAKKKKKVVAEDTAAEAAPKKKKKKGVEGDKPKKEKKERSKRTKLTEETMLSTVKAFKGGVREQAQSVIGAKTSYGKAVRLAKKQHDIPEKKMKNYVSWLVANGFVKVAA